MARAIESGGETLEFDRFQQIIDCGRLERLQRVAVERRHEYDLRTARLFYRVGDFEAVRQWHANVEQDHIRSFSPDDVDTLDAVGRLGDDGHVSRQFEEGANASTNERLVVDQHDADHADASGRGMTPCTSNP